MQELNSSTAKSAYEERKPTEPLIFHSDRGFNFQSKRFCEWLASINITKSVSRAHVPYGNSVMETCKKRSKSRVTRISILKFIDDRFGAAYIRRVLFQYILRRSFYKACKKRLPMRSLFLHVRSVLPRMRSVDRADRSAHATVYAHIRIDYIDVALGYSTYRAVFLAGAAADAIFINNICHVILPPRGIYSPILA